MKLVPTMFYDPEPSRENFDDYKLGGQKEFEEAHNEWKRRQICPHASKSKQIAPGVIEYTGRVAERYYEQHRLRFKGFERIPVNWTDKMYRFGKLLISFKQECVRVTIERLDLTCQDGMSLEYFRQTCQEKGINLQEI